MKERDIYKKASENVIPNLDKAYEKCIENAKIKNSSRNEKKKGFSFSRILAPAAVCAVFAITAVIALPLLQNEKEPATDYVASEKTQQESGSAEALSSNTGADVSPASSDMAASSIVSVGGDDPASQSVTVISGSVDTHVDSPCIKMNEIKNTISGAPRYFDPALYHKENRTVSDMADYFGYDISKLFVTDEEVASAMVYAGANEFTITVDKDGNFADDAVRYQFTDSNGKTINVFASKMRKPYDTVYELETNAKSSVITPSGKSAEALFAQKFMPGKTLAVADFECGGVKFRVELINTNTEPSDMNSYFETAVYTLIDNFAE